MRAYLIACLLAATLTACGDRDDPSSAKPSSPAGTPMAAVQVPVTSSSGNDLRKEAAITDPSPSSAGLPLPTCEEVQASGNSNSARGDAFYARYPKVLVSPESVEGVALTPGEIDNVVQYLTCAADATDYDPTVAENGLALFASHRHGKAALARLAALRKTGDPSAKQFEEQIKGYLAGPGE